MPRQCTDQLCIRVKPQVRSKLVQAGRMARVAGYRDGWTQGDLIGDGLQALCDRLSKRLRRAGKPIPREDEPSVRVAGKPFRGIAKPERPSVDE